MYFKGNLCSSYVRIFRFQDGLRDADRLNLRLFKAELQTFIEGYDCQGWEI